MGYLGTKPNVATTLPDNIVTADKIASGAVTDPKIAAMAATKLTGVVPDANAPSGSVIQVVQHKTTARSQISASGNSTVTATSGTQYTSFTFTPSFATSKLLLLSSNILIGEYLNNADCLYMSATHGGDTLIGSVMCYSGYSHWASGFDTAFVSFNHLFDSWGTSTRTISIRVGATSNPSYIAVNYPNAATEYANQFNSPNQHEVTFTILEIAA